MVKSFVNRWRFTISNYKNVEIASKFSKTKLSKKLKLKDICCNFTNKFEYTYSLKLRMPSIDENLNCFFNYCIQHSWATYLIKILFISFCVSTVNELLNIKGSVPYIKYLVEWNLFSENSPFSAPYPIVFFIIVYALENKGSELSTNNTICLTHWVGNNDKSL